MTFTAPLKGLSVLLLISLFLVSCAGIYQKQTSHADLGCESYTQVSRRITCYTEKIKKDPNNVELYLRRADCFKEFMKYSAALYDYATAYELAGEDASIARQVACMYARLGASDKALEWFRYSGELPHGGGDSGTEIFERCLDQSQLETIVSERVD